eukprot:GHVS01005138.1.p1 GENE.GHVS01005138.1~~GHVS01005138.1.p1  ORF type:complete len:438 (+),score=105.56 GHVS01005138.1:208-1521(+)
MTKMLCSSPLGPFCITRLLPPPACSAHLQLPLQVQRNFSAYQFPSSELPPQTVAPSPQTSSYGGSGGGWRNNNARREGGGGPWERKANAWEGGGRQQRYPSQHEEGGPNNHAARRSWGDGSNFQAGRREGPMDTMNGGGRDGSSPRYPQYRNNQKSFPKVQDLTPNSYTMFGGSTMMLVRPFPALFMDEEVFMRKRYKCLVDGSVSFTFMRRKAGDGRRFDKDNRIVFRARPADLAMFFAPLPTCSTAAAAVVGGGSNGKMRKRDYQKEAAAADEQTGSVHQLVEVGRAENREEKQSLRVYVSDEQEGGNSNNPCVVIAITFPSAVLQSKAAARAGGENNAYVGDEGSDRRAAGSSSGPAGHDGAGLEGQQQQVAESQTKKGQMNEASETWQVKTTVGELQALQCLLQSALPSLYGWQVLSNPFSVNGFLAPSTQKD